MGKKFLKGGEEGKKKSEDTYLATTTATSPIVSGNSLFTILSHSAASVPSTRTHCKPYAIAHDARTTARLLAK